MHGANHDGGPAGLPSLIADTQARLDDLATSTSGTINPFENIYDLVFQLLVRMLACSEIADDPSMLKRTLDLWETIEHSSTTTAILFPWFPSLALIKRTIAGCQFYMMFKKIVHQRRNKGRRGDDPLQYLLDCGDTMRDIIRVS